MIIFLLIIFILILCIITNQNKIFQIESYDNTISLYKVDITKVNIECIVNAANPSGLGCNIPGHCIDSAIHLAAGPELLEECKTLNGVPTGQAKITKGYNLLAKYVIHVTG